MSEVNNDDILKAAEQAAIQVESVYGRDIGYWHTASDEFYCIDLTSDSALGSARFVCDVLNWLDFPTIEKVAPAYGDEEWCITGSPRATADLKVRAVGDTLALACARALVEATQ